MAPPRKNPFDPAAQLQGCPVEQGNTYPENASVYPENHGGTYPDKPSPRLLPEKVSWEPLDQDTKNKIKNIINPPPVQTDVNQVLSQRGKIYGRFSDHARIAQALKDIVRAEPGWNRLTPNMKEAIDMTFHKIARSINGDPRHVDNWVDTAGYNKLVADELSGDDH